MQSNDLNANKVSIICILESSLLEYGTSVRPYWADKPIISRSNSIIYTSYDALLSNAICHLRPPRACIKAFQHRTFDFISQFGQSELTITKDTRTLPQIAVLL